MKVGVIGASGYTGGELIRLLMFHPKVEVATAVSREYAGNYVFRVHPNLRGVTQLKFTPLDIPSLIETCDLVFMATPHGASSKMVPQFLDAGIKVIDLSADFRLKNPSDYSKWYGWEHPHPDLLERSVYGLPELHREEIRTADLVAGPGCNSTSVILAMAPIVKMNSIDLTKIVADVKVGSSGVGGKPSLSTHHPERYGVIRPYKPTGHRHTAEVEQELGLLAGTEITACLSLHSVNVVRGILSTIHLFLTKDLSVTELWKAYRAFYRDEPFIRVVRDREGIYRLPDPKIVAGSNFCDIGFELDSHANRLVLLSALDNLMKGAAGTAVQDLNIILGVDEKTGLENPGYHPM